VSVTETELCNLALATCGVTTQITSLTDGSLEAKVCTLTLQPVVDAFLEETLWNRATKRTTLTKASSTPVYEWSYEYVLPSDFLKIRKVSLSETDYSVERNSVNQLCIMTNSAGPLDLQYVARIPVGYMSGKMVEALELSLASHLARKLKNDFSLANNLFQLYRAALARAKGENKREGTATGQPFYDTELAKLGY
jgi:hypothetical protein